MTITRTAIEPGAAEAQEAFSDKNGDKVDTIVQYFNRQDDREQIKTAIGKMWGWGIKVEADPAKKSESLETYEKQAFKTQLDSDQVEAFSVGFGAKITNALATMCLI